MQLAGSKAATTESHREQSTTGQQRLPLTTHAAVATAVALAYMGLAWLLVRWICTADLVPLWVPTGMAVAVILHDRRHTVPAVVGVILGEGIFDALMGGTPVKIFWWVTANAAETLVAGTAIRALLLRANPQHDRPSLESPADAGWLAVGVATGAAVGAAIATIRLAVVSGSGHHLAFAAKILLGDGMGILAMAPFGLGASPWTLRPRSRRDAIELLCFLAVLSALTIAAFRTDIPIAYLVAPLIGILGLRFRGFALPASLVAIGWAVHATSLGRGPFVLSGRDHLVQVQCFTAAVLITSIMSSAIATAEERRRQRLEATQERHRHLVEAASEAYIELEGPDGLIIDVNRRITEIFGLEPEDVIGRTVRELVAPSAWADVEAAREKIASGQPAVFEMMIPSMRGERRLLVSSRPVSRYDGSDGRIQLLATDVTDLYAERTARQQIEQRLLDVERAERARLAQELHDGPVQLLVATDLHLGRLRRSLPSESSERVFLVEHMIEDAIKALRQGMLEIRPPDVRTGGLGAALEECALLFLAGTDDIRVMLDVALEPPVTGEVAEVLYKCAREAIANCVRHARCSRVEVTLTRHGGWLELTVHDDGTGIDPAYRLGREGHLGIGAMHTRAQDAGGECRIESSTEGSTVTIRIPEQASVSVFADAS